MCRVEEIRCVLPLKCIFQPLCDGKFHQVLEAAMIRGTGYECCAIKSRHLSNKMKHSQTPAKWKKILPHLGSVIHNCLTDTKITRCTRWPGWMCQNMWTVDYSVYKWVGVGLWIGDILLSINSVYLFICLQRTDWGLMFPEILLVFDQAALVWPQLFDLHFERCGVQEFGVRTCPVSPK